MSPIIDLQRRLVEVGRIRLGDTKKSGTKRVPIRLNTWKLTSRDWNRLHAASQHYGGTVTAWERFEGQHQLLTETDTLRILLMPGQTITQFYELWSGGGCVRRCDGQHELLSDGACQCPAEYTDRNELAKDGKACKPTTRLSVLLPEIEGIGCWRLETHGYYAAVELAGTAALLQEATRRGALLPARLRIDQRTVVSGGQTKKFPVPVIDIDVRLPELQATVAPELEPGGYTPVVRELPAGTGVGEALDAVAREASPRPRVRQQAPLGPAGPVPSTEPIAAEGDEMLVDVATAAQQKLMLAKARAAGLDDDARHALVQRVTGQPSTKQVPRAQVDDVLAEIERVRAPAA